jgi:hypothetical protein
MSTNVFRLFFSVKSKWFMPPDGVRFGKYLVLLTMIIFNMSE